jgi:hypothetical protein
MEKSHIQAEERNCHTQVSESGTSDQGSGSVGTVKVMMVSRVLRVQRDVDRSVMLGVSWGCAKAQVLMEAKGSETEEVTWNNGDDGSVGPRGMRMETDVGKRRSETGDRRSEIGGRRSE